MELYIANMTCGGCARGVTASIQQLDPDAKVDIDLSTKIVHVQSSIEPQHLLETLEEDGFPAQIR